jgi:hypothetical protein
MFGFMREYFQYQLRLIKEDLVKYILMTLVGLLFLSLIGFAAEKTETACYTLGNANGFPLLIIEPDITAKLSTNDRQRLQDELAKKLKTGSFEEIVSRVGEPGRDATYITLSDVTELQSTSEKKAKVVINVLRKHMPNYFFLKTKYACSSDTVKVR